jgi:hypothetical protein
MIDVIDLGKDKSRWHVCAPQGLETGPEARPPAPALQNEVNRGQGHLSTGTET